jgi:hypothetical protein
MLLRSHASPFKTGSTSIRIQGEFSKSDVPVMCLPPNSCHKNFHRHAKILSGDPESVTPNPPISERNNIQGHYIVGNTHYLCQ